MSNLAEALAKDQSELKERLLTFAELLTALTTGVQSAIVSLGITGGNSVGNGKKAGKRGRPAKADDKAFVAAVGVPAAGKGKGGKGGKRKPMSEAAKAKIRAAAKARWAKVKAAGKKSL